MENCKNYKSLYQKYNLKCNSLIHDLYGGMHINRQIVVQETELNIDEITSYFAIQIDEYYFKIICYGLLEQRIGVFLISSLSSDFNEYEKFWIYTSQSELDFCRLLYRASATVPYHKGHIDYTQQSLIDIRLQKFILEKFKLSKYINNLQISSLYGSGDITNLEIKSVIDNVERVVDVDPFNKFTLHCGYANRDSSGNTNLMNEIYNKVIQQLTDYCLGLELTYNTSEPIYLYNYSKNFDGAIYFNIDVFSIELTNKINSADRYIMYFMVYDLCIFNFVSLYNDDVEDPELKYKYDHRYINSYKQNKICKYRNYFAPISIVPQYSQITKFGLPNKIIPTGNYTCKVLEYNTQCTEYENAMFGIKDTGYSFIGNRYNNIFPFNIIKREYPDVINSHAPAEISQEMIDFFSIGPPQFTRS